MIVIAATPFSPSSFIIMQLKRNVVTAVAACVFAEKGTPVYEIARNGFLIFPFSFLFCGLNIFTSATFTALSNGKLSAILSFLRTFGL